MHDHSEAALEAYWAVLETLGGQALKMIDPLHARVSGRAAALIAAFPGPTMSNAECVALMADVNFLLTPKLTYQILRRKTYRRLQASRIARLELDGPLPFAPETPTWLRPPRAVETASGEVAANRVGSAPSAADWLAHGCKRTRPMNSTGHFGLL